MRNVGVAVGATAWLLASTGESSALDVARVVAAAGRDRIAQEQKGGVNDTILTAWRKWYGEAVRSASRLLAGAPSEKFSAEIESLASSVAK